MSDDDFDAFCAFILVFIFLLMLLFISDKNKIIF